MKAIRILLYTDIFEFNKEGEARSCVDLQKFIKLKLARLADVNFTVVSRHFDLTQTVPPKALIRLTHDLLYAHDELWVFGFGNENIKDFPTFAFDDEEVELLSEWMKTGGVMVTGDHSQLGQSDNTVCPAGVSHDEFIGRGAPLGHRIPRARQLRVWKGPPTNCDVDPSELKNSDTQNTLDKVGKGKDLELEADEFPQTLEGISSPPHFLFTYGVDDEGLPSPIIYFPDHQHEGRVLIPEPYDESWPQRPPDPEPEFVAFGRDKRFTVDERVYPLVVAYDGDCAGIGRIVADTSFHHYINLNLRKIDGRDAARNPLPGTPLDQIAQFYANLAYWLAPKPLRDEIKRDLLFRSSVHIGVLETVGNGTAKLGSAAGAALKLEFGAANLYRIFKADAACAEQHLPDQLLTFAVTGRGEPEGFGALDGDRLLGSLVESYHRFFTANGLNALHLREDPTTPAVTMGGLGDGLLAQFPTVEGLLNRPAGAASAGHSEDDQLKQKENEMNSQAGDATTTFLCGGGWDSTVKRNGAEVEIGVFDLKVDEHGKLSGTFTIGSSEVPIEGGTCGTNHIIIRRKDGGSGTLVYEGDILETGGGSARVTGGKRRRESDNLSAEEGTRQYAGAGKGAALFDGDDWDAVKTTTFE